jgi:hypothetical protein
MDASACMYFHSWIIDVQYAYTFINNYVIQPEVYIPEILHYYWNVCVCAYVCVHVCACAHIYRTVRPYCRNMKCSADPLKTELTH